MGRRIEIDFSQAACRGPAQWVFDEHSRTGSTVTARACRWVCLKRCPMTRECRRWVLATERPAGGYGGIIAGLAPKQRRDTVARRLKLTEQRYAAQRGTQVALTYGATQVPIAVAQTETMDSVVCSVPVTGTIPDASSAVTTEPSRLTYAL